MSARRPAEDLTPKHSIRRPMSIRDLMTHDIHSVPHVATCRDAAKMMAKHDIGDVLVTDAKGVRGITLKSGQRVISLIICEDKPAEKRRPLLPLGD